MIGPWRAIVSRTVHPVKWEWCFGHRGAHSVTVRLECGHEKTYKGSGAPRGNRARCDRECARP